MRTTLMLLNEIGYDTHYKILVASNYGIPQKRERLYIVCFRKDLKVGSFNFPLSEKTDVALEDILLPRKIPRLMTWSLKGLMLFGKKI